MSPPRLDRLSALLQGLAPGFEMLRPGTHDVVVAPQTRAAQLHLHLVTDGEVVLVVPDQPETVITGPAIVVCRSDRPHSLSVRSEKARQGLLCIRATFAGPVAPLLLGEFGASLVVPLGDADGALSQVVALIASELAQPRCGQPALLERAGDILFIGLLRHLVANPRAGGGLFGGLADPRIARALVAIHSTPHRNWTLETLAMEAGMSRTAFATRFRNIMHCPPGNYLGKLRISIARRALESGSGLKRAARESGYSSPATLSRALALANTREQGA